MARRGRTRPPVMFHRCSQPPPPILIFRRCQFQTAKLAQEARLGTLMWLYSTQFATESGIKQVSYISGNRKLQHKLHYLLASVDSPLTGRPWKTRVNNSFNVRGLMGSVLLGVERLSEKHAECKLYKRWQSSATKV